MRIRKGNTREAKSRAGIVMIAGPALYIICHSAYSCLEVSKNTHDTLQIITDSPIDTDRFQRVLQDAVKRDIAEFDREIARNNRRVIWEAIVGIILISLGVTLSVYLDRVLLTIISLFGTMAVRDAIKINTTFNHDIKSLKNCWNP